MKTKKDTASAMEKKGGEAGGIGGGGGGGGGGSGGGVCVWMDGLHVYACVRVLLRV